MRGPWTRLLATVRGLGRRMRPCSGAVFIDQPVERPYIRRLSGVATPLRHLVITQFHTDKPVEISGHDGKVHVRRYKHACPRRPRIDHLG